MNLEESIYVALINRALQDDQGYWGLTHPDAPRKSSYEHLAACAREAAKLLTASSVASVVLGSVAKGGGARATEHTSSKPEHPALKALSPEELAKVVVPTQAEIQAAFDRIPSQLKHQPQRPPRYDEVFALGTAISQQAFLDAVAKASKDAPLSTVAALFDENPPFAQSSADVAESITEAPSHVYIKADEPNHFEGDPLGHIKYTAKDPVQTVAQQIEAGANPESLWLNPPKPSRAVEMSQYICSLLEEAGHTGIRRSILQQKMPIRFKKTTVDDFNAAIALLLTDERILEAVVETGNRGAPPRFYYLIEYAPAEYRNAKKAPDNYMSKRVLSAQGQR